MVLTTFLSGFTIYPCAERHFATLKWHLPAELATQPCNHAFETLLPYKTLNSRGVHTALVKFSTMPAKIGIKILERLGV